MKSLPVPWHLVTERLGTRGACPGLAAVASRSGVDEHGCFVSGGHGGAMVRSRDIVTRELHGRLRRNGRYRVLVHQMRLVIVFQDDGEVVETADVATQLEAVTQIDGDGRILPFDRLQVRVLQR